MSVKINYGINSTSSEALIGKTLSEAIETVRPLFNIPAGATSLLNSENADMNTVLEAGDTITVYKPSGEKGAEIKYGINSVKNDAFDGKSLKAVLAVAKGMLNLPSENVSAMVNNNPVSEDYIVQPGDVITTFKAAGEKGSR